MMLWIRNLSLRNKLIFLSVPPMLVLVFLFSERIYFNHQQQQSMQSLLHSTELLHVLNPVVTELQRERGRTAIVLANPTATDAINDLRKQQYQSDQRIAVFRAAPQARDAKDIQQALQQITNARQLVATGRAEASQVIPVYTRSIATLMMVTEYILKEASVAEIMRPIAVYAALSNMAELAGQERALGSAYVRSQHYTTESLLSIVLLQGQQDSWEKVSEIFINQTEQQAWQQFLNSREHQQLLRLRQLLVNTNTVQQLQGSQWFDVTTARLDKLNQLKGAVLDEIVQQAQHEQHRASTGFWSSMVLMVAVLGSGTFLTLSIIVQLNSQVRTFARALQVAMNNKDLTVNAKTNTKDEIGRLSESVDELYEMFSSSLQQIDEASEQMTAAMERSGAITLKNTEHIDKQQQQVEQVATASEEMSATSEQISQNVLQVADAALNVREKSENGEQHVRNSVAQVRVLAESVSSVDVLMNDLQQRSSSMIQVIDVIRNLAEQTNLLALNAAIEAARAGEHGRGFAVVADEVRTLATRTHESTQQIQEIIESFTELSSNAAQSIQESHKVSEDTLQLSNELEEIFNSILIDVKRISDMASEIATASEEQVAVSREVARSMDAIQHDAVQTYQGAVEIHEVTEQQTQLAMNLKRLAAEFKTRN